MRVRHQTDNVEEIVAATIEAMEAVKGKEIVTLDLREITTAVTDYFVICHAPSKTQVDAIADKVEELVFEKTHKSINSSALSLLHSPTLTSIHDH